MHPRRCPPAPAALRLEFLAGYYSWLGKQKNGRDSRYRPDSLRLFLSTALRYVHWLDGKQLLSPGITADAIEGKLRGVLGKKKRTLERRHREADDTVGVLLGYYATQLASTPVSPKHPRKRLILLRDHAILQVQYATAGRASEVAQLARRDIQEGKKVAAVEITGKGNKRRPLLLTARRWRPSGLTWKPAGPTNMTACSSRTARMPATR